MSSYMPGNGLKKPLNMLQGPVYPDIRKAPPRFTWSRKNWEVDAGQTLKQVEDTPQFYDSTVLFQSRSYNSQHAYGNYPTYDVVVNKAFRPPLIDRDDVLPLSRIPRPAVVPRVNPGTAYGGGGAYQAQNSTAPPELHKFLTDRVKEATIRPTFFAPLYTPVDNSVLPDLELNVPAISATAGYLYKPQYNYDSSAGENSVVDKISTSGIAGNKFQNNGMLDSGFEGVELYDNRPEVSATAGTLHRANGMLTNQDISGIEYIDTTPIYSLTSGTRHKSGNMIQPNQKELFEATPRISMTSGRKERMMKSVESPDVELYEKIEGNQPYVNPNNTHFKTDNYKDSNSPFREKTMAYSRSTPYTVNGFVPRSGITVPNGVNLRNTNKN